MPVPLQALPTLEEAEKLLASAEQASVPASKQMVIKQRNTFRQCLPELSRLEQTASAATARELDACQALACLSSRRCRWLVKLSAVTLGRSTPSHGEVKRKAASTLLPCACQIVQPYSALFQCCYLMKVCVTAERTLPQTPPHTSAAGGH